MAIFGHSRPRRADFAVLFWQSPRALVKSEICDEVKETRRLKLSNAIK